MPGSPFRRLIARAAVATLAVVIPVAMSPAPASAAAGEAASALCSAEITPIPAIQGSGAATPMSGETVTTRGVVVGDYEGASPALRGFYLQDPVGDGDHATSDGIFVFNGGNQDLVELGDVVTVVGRAGESQGQTQMSVSSENISTCGTGTVAPTEVTLPLASATALENLEGMLVKMTQVLSVTEHFQLGRFGQVVLSSGGRLQQPTNVVAPGAAAVALQTQNNLNRIIVDDDTQAQNPDPIAFGRGGQPLSATNTLRGGDTTTGAIGVMTYTWGGNRVSPNAYRLRPLGALGGTIDFKAAYPRPEEPKQVGGDVRVVGMNLLNYFNTLDNKNDNCRGGVSGPPLDCRGANNALELERQTAKTVAAIIKLDADVIGVNEVENDGYGADSALQTLVDAVNADGGAGTYAVLDVDTRTGQTDALGSDAIKVGAIYRPDAVSPVGDTAALNSVEFVNGGDASPKNRPSLAQAWKVNATNGVFITDVNHLKSKGSACETPDTGDGQANCAIVRNNAVRALLTWLDSDPTGTGDQDVLLVGDYNSYAMETPIKTLEEGGFTNLVNTFVGKDAYSYVFDGQWGYLDQALGSTAIVDQVTGVVDYHINSDEPSVLDYNTDFKSAAQIESLYAKDEFRVSDHDPVLVGLRPNSPPVVAASFDPVLVQCGPANATLTVDINDRDEADTHTVAVDWGDGRAATSQDVAAGTDSVTPTHTYALAGRYTATVTVTDSHGHEVTTSADAAVAYDSSGIRPPFKKGSLTAKFGSTVPVKISFTDCDGTVPTDIDPTVTVTQGGATVLRGDLVFADGEWSFKLKTGDLRDRKGTYTVTVTVPSTGQTSTATLHLR
ncbi:MAG: ExeM/NucH family extracellular endonuclease [Ornithinibacter sp.]